MRARSVEVPVREVPVRPVLTLPGAILCAGILAFCGGVISYLGQSAARYDGGDHHAGQATRPDVPTGHPSGLPAVGRDKPVTVTADTFPKTLHDHSTAVHAADARAREMMRREGLSPGATAWVCHFVNRGLKDIPEVSAEDLQAARMMLTRSEVIEWLSAQAHWLGVKGGVPPP